MSVGELTIPLTAAQRATWLAASEAFPEPLLNITAAYELDGELDLARFARALRGLLASHDQLRLRVHRKEGEVSGCRWPVPAVPPLAVVSLERLPADVAEALSRRYRIREAARAVDPSLDVPLRALLLRRSDRSHALIVTVSHLVADGTSMGILIDDLALLYDASRDRAEATLVPAPPAFERFAERAPSERDVERRRTGVEWWRESIVRPREDTPGDVDEATPTATPSCDALTLRWRFEPALGATLVSLARTLKTSFHVLGLAAFALELHRRHAGDTTVIMGSNVGERFPDYRRTVGLFAMAQAVALPHEARAEPFPAYLQRVRACLAEAADHPLAADATGDLCEHGLLPAWCFQTLSRRSRGEASCEGLTIRFDGFESVCAWPEYTGLLFLFEPDDRGFVGDLVHRTAVLTPSEAIGWMAGMDSMLRAISETPEASVGELLKRSTRAGSTG